MPKKRILLVEDDEDIRRNLQDILESEGYQLYQATNGREALDLLKASGVRPSLILLDLMMPEMDGFQFKAEQETDPVLASIPVVIMTADAQFEAKKQLIGAKDFIRKPLDLAELLEKLERNCA